MSVDVHYGDKQGLDRTRRYLVPVARLPLPDEPDLVHLALYQWLPQFDAWATGPSICGRSTTQGPLPDGTAITCPACEEHRPDYERHLAGHGQSPEQQLAEVCRLLSQWGPRLMETQPVLFRKLDDLLQLSGPKEP
ncbi:hypothetical protein F0L17_14475 [Streptomyces sp. TRM43335]|uniref:Uncharacterized protein n=1 Tax=Streptomyces taklimakanensis TaxID=2569853 RepID=A0A6G2BEF9_9ACTN|nr:hypothetical protein [Streptomyces taklimakanensis]MTE20292.1 hypothetical protein [Streptomyces taklimakanensis]